VKVLWLSWKDRHHPQSGGAETVSGEIMDRLVRDGHEVKMITARYKNSKDHEIVNGVEVFRTGNRYTVYLKAKNFYKTKQLKDWPDIVIDEMNTIPFGSAYYVNAKNILLCYQLAREVWLYQTMFPLSIIGYASEPIMLRALARKYELVATESESTKKDLGKYGFTNVEIFRVGTYLPPVKELPSHKRMNLILSLGSIRPMKRTLDAIKAFESARDKDMSLEMVVAGDSSSSYAKKVIAYVEKSRHKNAIQIKGRVSQAEQLKLMSNAAIILVTSIKEGWGLIVTEANGQGTPAIVYDTDGLRDSVIDKKTGLLCTNKDYEDMADKILSLLSDKQQYETLQRNAWEFSKQFTFENSYRDFLSIISRTS
jgi:glycosyltransferase involved in cell wall biosynthesis